MFVVIRSDNLVAYGPFPNVTVARTWAEGHMYPYGYTISPVERVTDLDVDSENSI